MDCKQRTIDKLLQTLVDCLQRESLNVTRIFFSYRTLKLINSKNFNKSKLSAAQDNKAIVVNNAPLDKDNSESIDDNSCNSNECNKIPGDELSNKIANDNSKNHSRINKNHQNNTKSFNNSRTIQYDVSRNDIKLMEMCENQKND